MSLKGRLFSENEKFVLPGREKKDLRRIRAGAEVKALSRRDDFVHEETATYEALGGNSVGEGRVRNLHRKE